MPSGLGSNVPAADHPPRPSERLDHGTDADADSDAARLLEAMRKTYPDDPPHIRFTPDEPAVSTPDKATEPAESDRMFRIDRTEEATIVDHPGRPDGQTVLAGHGYHVGDFRWVEIPRGTELVFYCDDGETLDDSKGMAVETGEADVDEELIAYPGTRVANYALAHPHGLTVTSSSRLVDSDRNLSDLLEPDMGRVHWAACRERLQGIP